VGNTGKWAQKADGYGGLFQFNRSTAWSAVEPASGVTIPGFISTIDENMSWNETTNAVCPTGWRLPTQVEQQALHDASTTGSTSGAGTWVEASAKGNAVAGKFYGPNHAACSLSGSMDGCIFLPASNNRNSTGARSNIGTTGYYWSSVQYDTTTGYRLNFDSGSSAAAVNRTKADAYSVRCVKSM
jgi:uncharacterized protein (TIGR02145 family)